MCDSRPHPGPPCWGLGPTALLSTSLLAMPSLGWAQGRADVAEPPRGWVLAFISGARLEGPGQRPPTVPEVGPQLLQAERREVGSDPLPHPPLALGGVPAPRTAELVPVVLSSDPPARGHVSAQGLLGLPAPHPAPQPAAELQLLTGVPHGQRGCMRSPHPEHRPTPSRPRAGQLFQSAPSAVNSAARGKGGRGAAPGEETQQGPLGRGTSPGKARSFKGGTEQARDRSQGPSLSPTCPPPGKVGRGTYCSWCGVSTIRPVLAQGAWGFRSTGQSEAVREPGRDLFPEGAASASQSFRPFPA